MEQREPTGEELSGVVRIMADRSKRGQGKKGEKEFRLERGFDGWRRERRESGIKGGREEVRECQPMVWEGIMLDGGSEESDGEGELGERRVKR
jgi:hypothetical protein